MTWDEHKPIARGRRFKVLLLFVAAVAIIALFRNSIEGALEHLGLGVSRVESPEGLVESAIAAEELDAAIKALREDLTPHDPATYFALASALMQEGSDSSLTEAARLFEVAANQGHARAQYNIGLMNLQGYGVSQDYISARRWFSLATDHGDPESHYLLGMMSEEGLGSEPDIDQAVRLYQRAAEDNVTEAQVALGTLYAEGKGVPLDASEALAWLSLAEESKRQQQGDARNDLGRFIEQLRGSMTKEELLETEARIEAYRARAQRPINR